MMLADELTEQDATAVEAHATSCPRCQEVLEQLAGSSDLDHRRLATQEPVTEQHVKQGDDQAFFHKLQNAPPWNPSPPQPATDRRLPELPEYEVLGKLGVGGMGVVYQARDVRLNRLVAIKMVHAGAHARPQDRLRFQIEAEAVAALQHPHIVQIHEVGEADGCPYLVLEYVAGGSLAQRMRAQPLAFRAAAELVRTLALAVEHAHRHGIIHRDLKPANVLLTAEGQPKITDFGLAKRLGGDGGQTATGEVFGTPSYMAPEQARGDKQQVGTATDVYALGAILYDLLTGRPPFQADTPLATMLLVANEEPKRPSHFGVKLPRDLETICLKCLQKEPHKRYPSAEALAEDLRRFLADEPIWARPTGLWERGAKWARRRPLLATLTGAIAGLLVALLGVGSLAIMRNVQLDEQRARTERSLYVARMNLAQQALEGDQFQQLEDLLALADFTPETADRLRGLEWYYMRQLCRGGYSQSLSPHVEEITALAFSKEGNSVAIAGEGNTFLLQNLRTGQEKARMTLSRPVSRRPWPKTVTFHPDGTILVTTSGRLRFWETASGRELPFDREYRPTRDVYSAAIAPDGKALATGKADGTVTLWDLATRREYATLAGRHRWPVIGLAFSPDGKTLASRCVGENNETKLWDVESSSERGNLLPLKGAGFFGLSFAPDGQTLAVGEGDGFRPGRSGRVLFMNTATGEVRNTWSLPGNGVWSVCYSPDGTALAVGTNNGPVKVLAADTGVELATLFGHRGRVVALAFTPDGRVLASGGLDNTVKLWEHPLRPAPPRLERGDSRFTSVALAPDGKTAATGSSDGRVILWDLASWQPLGPVFAGNGKGGCHVAFSPDGRLLATPGSDLTLCSAGLALDVLGAPLGRDLCAAAWGLGAGDANVVWVYDVASTRVHVVLRGHTRVVLGVCFSPDGSLVATAGHDGTVRVWGVADGRERACFPGGGVQVWSVAFSPDGRWLASGSEGVKLWDLGRQQEFASLPGPGGNVMAVAFSPDGRRLAAAGWGGRVSLWDVATRTKLTEFRGHTGAVLSLAFTSDGQTLVTGSIDNTVKLWDVPLGQERFTFRGHTDLVHSVALAAGDALLATASYDGTVRLWHAPRDN